MDAEDRALRDEVLMDLARGAEARTKRGEETDETDVVLIALLHPQHFEIKVRLKD